MRSRRSTGTIAQAAAASSRRPASVTEHKMRHASSSSVSWPIDATVSAPRRARIAVSERPAGGCSRKARLAWVSARTCGVPYDAMYCAADRPVA